MDSSSGATCAVGSVSSFSELCFSALDDIIDELSIGVVFEVHRSIKLNYFHLDDLFEAPSNSIANTTSIETDPTNASQEMMPTPVPKLPLCTSPYCDIFGMPLNQKKQIDCSCPNCGRLVAATRLAPHLEKCMGMGRSSSRIASRRLTQMSNNPTSSSSNHNADGSSSLDAFGLNELTRNSNSPSSGSEKASTSGRYQRVKSKKGCGAGGTLEGVGGGSESGGKKKKLSNSQQKMYKEAVRIVSSVNSYPEYLALNSEQCQKVLSSLCGVVDQSHHHGQSSKMCRKSLKCKVHTDYQRLELRNSMLESEDYLEQVHGGSKVTESRVRNSDSMHEVFGDFDIEPQDDSIGEGSNLVDTTDTIGNVFDNLSNWDAKSSIDLDPGIPTYPNSIFQTESPNFGSSISFLSSKRDSNFESPGMISKGKEQHNSPSKTKTKSSKKSKKK